MLLIFVVSFCSSVSWSCNWCCCGGEDDDNTSAASVSSGAIYASSDSVDFGQKQSDSTKDEGNHKSSTSQNMSFPVLDSVDKTPAVQQEATQPPVDPQKVDSKESNSKDWDPIIPISSAQSGEVLPHSVVDQVNNSPQGSRRGQQVEQESSNSTFSSEPQLPCQQDLVDWHNSSLVNYVSNAATSNKGGRLATGSINQTLAISQNQNNFNNMTLSQNDSNRLQHMVGWANQSLPDGRRNGANISGHNAFDTVNEDS